MCLYQDSDILLLDDPLSALDANVASYVMETTFFKELKGKTRILVTHSLQHLQYADYIYVVEDGKISIGGTFEDMKETELMKKFNELEEIKESSNSMTSQNHLEDKDEEAIKLNQLKQILKYQKKNNERRITQESNHSVSRSSLI